MKLRKGELAAKVAEQYEGTGYLPDILVTPTSTGQRELTAEGVAAAAVRAVAAE